MSIVALTLLACTTGDGSTVEPGGPVADYTLSLEPIVPLSGNPFDGADRIDLVLDSGVGEPVRVTLDAPESGDRAEAHDLPALDGTRIVVEGYADGELVAWGRSAPLTADTGEVEATVFVSRPEEMARLGGLPDERCLGMGLALGNGRFLYLGGADNNASGSIGKAVDTTYLLDLDHPTPDLAFTELGTLPEYTDAQGETQTIREDFTMTRLSEGDAGMYLMVGGGPAQAYGNSTQLTSDVRLFDPETLEFGEPFRSKDALSNARSRHVALLNQQGSVLVWGGMTSTPNKNQISLVRDGEMYDPVARTFTRVDGEAGSIGVAMGDLGDDGTLVSGGVLLNSPAGDDPALWYVSDACIRVSLRGDVTECTELNQVAGHTIVGLPDGDALAFGGVVANGEFDQNTTVDAVKTVWRFRHGAQVWDEVGTMKLARAGHTATLLDDTHVLIAGGASAWGPFKYSDPALSCVEIYDVANDTSSMVGACTAADDAGGLSVRAQAPAVMVEPDLGVLFVGGIDGTNGGGMSASWYALAHE